MTEPSLKTQLCSCKSIAVQQTAVPEYVTFLNCITNISPRNIIPLQMRKCNGHLSNKNGLSNFLNEFLLREESFNLAGRSFQIVGLERDLERPWSECHSNVDQPHNVM